MDDEAAATLPMLAAEKPHSAHSANGSASVWAIDTRLPDPAAAGHPAHA